MTQVPKQLPTSKSLNALTQSIPSTDSTDSLFRSHSLDTGLYNMGDTTENRNSLIETKFEYDNDYLNGPEYEEEEDDEVMPLMEDDPIDTETSARSREMPKRRANKKKTVTKPTTRVLRKTRKNSELSEIDVD